MHASRGDNRETDARTHTGLEEAAELRLVDFAADAEDERLGLRLVRLDLAKGWQTHRHTHRDMHIRRHTQPDITRSSGEDNRTISTLVVGAGAGVGTGVGAGVSVGVGVCACACALPLRRREGGALTSAVLLGAERRRVVKG